MWLDAGGLEPPPNADRQEPHLPRPLKKSAPSLLDGQLFFERLEEAFLALLNNIHGRRTTQVDLRLTTTSFEGRSEPLRDDLDADLLERNHRASFTSSPGRRRPTPSRWSSPPVSRRSYGVTVTGRPRRRRSFHLTRQDIDDFLRGHGSSPALWGTSELAKHCSF